MSVIKFPGADKGLSPKKKISEEEKKVLIDGLIDVLDGVDELETIDLDKIDKKLFEKYLLQFPCYANLIQNIDPHYLYNLYEQTGTLTEEQELGLICVLELLTEYDFGFMLRDAFEVWSMDDTAAFIKIIAAHAVHAQKE